MKDKYITELSETQIRVLENYNISIEEINAIRNNPKFQIQILKKTKYYLIRDNIINNNREGLCYYIQRAIKFYTLKKYPSLSFGIIIPLFNKENAIRVANASYLYNVYWWCFDKERYKNRKYFLDWMILEIEKPYNRIYAKFDKRY